MRPILSKNNRLFKMLKKCSAGFKDKLLRIMPRDCFDFGPYKKKDEIIPGLFRNKMTNADHKSYAKFAKKIEKRVSIIPTTSVHFSIENQKCKSGCNEDLEKWVKYDGEFSNSYGS